MIAQRPAGAAPCVRAGAEHLPFADDSFDAALALLTVHHWSDWRAGLAEVRRVAPRRQVVFTWAADAQSHYWLIDEYLPFVTDFDDGYPTAPEIAASAARVAPRRAADPGRLHRRLLRRLLAPARGVPRSGRAGDDLDLRARPPRPRARSTTGLARLAADLDSGAWHERHADLLELDELDVGYRLVVAGG